ncbi:MAG: CopG family transcriptional regulator [Halioglobus sp.]|nr:CopG family transcriptional regulator [Halioglobus sp.]
MRTIVDLPEEQIETLKQLSKQSRQSRAELVRRAIAEYLRHHHSESSEDAFGIWRNQPRESLDYQYKLRDEWES